LTNNFERSDNVPVLGSEPQFSYKKPPHFALGGELVLSEVVLNEVQSR